MDGLELLESEVDVQLDLLVLAGGEEGEEKEGVVALAAEVVVEEVEVDGEEHVVDARLVAPSGPPEGPFP